TVERWVEETPAGFIFDVKLHRLLSRHVAPLDSLPVELRAGISTTPCGGVIATPSLVEALAEHVVMTLAPLVDAGRLGALLLQLSPVFEPEAHRLAELAELVDLLALYRVAVELRHRAWLDPEREDETLEWLEDHRAAWVGVDTSERDAVVVMPPLD